MESTTVRPQVQRPRDVQPVADAITKRVLRNRNTLSHGLNGRAAAVSAPDAAQIRKHMGQQLRKPVHQLLTVLVDDIRCGVPLATVTSALHEMIALLELEADSVNARPEDFVSLLRAETRAQGRLDLAQIKAMDEPNAPEVLDELVSAHSGYVKASDALIKNAMARLAILRGSCARAFSVAHQ